jgi:hypothetical protein
VALFDAHSIRSVISRLFQGELPVFNLGTNSGVSCDPELRETIGAVLAASKQTSIVDGRFKGGWITRAYGHPSEGVETYSSNSRAALTCTSLSGLRLTTGQRRSTKSAQRQPARQSSVCSRQFFPKSAAHEDDHTLSFPTGAKRAIGNPAS